MHVLEDAAAEIGDIEAVDDDQLVMELGHCTFLPCGSIWGGPTTPRAYELSFAQMCGWRKGASSTAVLLPQPAAGRRYVASRWANRHFPGIARPGSSRQAALNCTRIE
jgi:hypothetical protein